MNAEQLLGVTANTGMGILNNYWAQENYRTNLGLNYQYNEKAAQNADKRTRALYNDLYSPSALLEQYNKAGLSPSMMFGGTPGQGGTSGAMGAGAQGSQAPFMPISLLEGAQLAQIKAETDKTKAETKNIEKDTNLKALEEQWNKWRNYDKGKEFELLNATYENGATLFDEAINSNSYENFIKNTIEHNPLLRDYLNTENGRRQLNNIYMSANRFDRDIKVLSEEGVNAEFQESVLKCMNKEGIAEQKAETLINMLKAEAETSKLTVQQAGAWNDILERMGRKNETAKDILIVLSMIFNQAATNWKFFE